MRPLASYPPVELKSSLSFDLKRLARTFQNLTTCA